MAAILSWVVTLAVAHLSVTSAVEPLATPVGIPVGVPVVTLAPPASFTVMPVAPILPVLPVAPVVPGLPGLPVVPVVPGLPSKAPVLIPAQLNPLETEAEKEAVEAGEEEEEEEEGEEEGEEEEEEKASPTAIAIAATLFAAMGFLMMLTYLTNHQDKDMRKYTYQAVNATISIFAAVLIYTAFRQMMHKYVCEALELSAGYEIIFYFICLVAWLISMNVALAYFSGAFADLFGRPDDKETAEMNCKCFATLFAHMTGFASINFWAEVQHEYLKDSLGLLFLVVPMAIGFNLCVACFTKKLRKMISSGDDGTVDEFEMMWDEETADAEIDVMALTVSFTMVQALRFAVSGVLPNAEGLEAMETMQAHSYPECAILIGLGFFFGLAIFGVATALPKSVLEGEGTKEQVVTVIATLGMSFAWCVFFGARWLSASCHKFPEDPMLLGIVVAMFLSVGSFGSIRLLDRLADSECTGEQVDKAIIQVISAIGILIGFGWEQCFDMAVESIASSLPHPVLSGSIVCLLLAALVVPAWRWYILPMVVSEGWMFGFVIDEDNEKKWKEVTTHPRFQRVHSAVKNNDALLSDRAGSQSDEELAAPKGGMREMGLREAAQRR